jgi:3-hydroxyisobutyrate dehydrogenase-like beta-hydroxyacid dehydrogenase
LAGRTLVQLTNGTPEQARSLAVWAGAQHARAIDGGIMAIPPMIGSADAVILYSGCAAAFTEHRPLLEGLGTALFLGTDPGHAALLDLALLAAMYGLFGGFLQAAGMVRATQVTAGEMAELAVPWLAAMAAALPDPARQIDTRDYAGDAASALAMQAVAVDNIISTSAALGVDAGLIQPLPALMGRRIADGFGTDDLGGLIGLLRRAPP